LTITLICEQLVVMLHQADTAGSVVAATSCMRILLSPRMHACTACWTMHAAQRSCHKATRLQHITQKHGVSHVECEILDSMFTTDLLQLGPLLAMQLSYLNCARDVLQGSLRHECRGHDFAQLEVTLAMSSVQGFAANQSGDSVWPLTCHIRMRESHRATVTWEMNVFQSCGDKQTAQQGISRPAKCWH